MKGLRQRALNGEVLSGAFLNLGSGLTAELAGNAGYDWVLVDLEHGAGDHESLLPQLQAISATPAASLVRIAWNEAPRFKRVLDLGAEGVMVPYVSNAEEAANAAAAMRYPPAGVRGVAGWNRACKFGLGFADYFGRANDELLTIVQIETRESIENLDAIAATEGVDVLFLGPVDLSISLGIPRQFDHPDFLEAKRKIAAACKRAGKAAGLLTLQPEQLKGAIDDGFTFIGLGSDGSTVATGLTQLAAAFDKYR